MLFLNIKVIMTGVAPRHLRGRGAATGCKVRNRHLRSRGAATGCKLRNRHLRGRGAATDEYWNLNPRLLAYTFCYICYVIIWRYVRH